MTAISRNPNIAMPDTLYILNLYKEKLTNPTTKVKRKSAITTHELISKFTRPDSS